jgi:predicted amidohydrolase YtcJ
VKLLALSLTLATFSAVAQSPDWLYFHGNILTGAHLRADDKSAIPAHVTALAIRAGKIVAIGTDQQILALKGPRTNAIDLKGAFAMPGFNDAHTHIAYAGQQHLSVDLDNVPTLAAMQAKIHSYTANLTPGQWIVGGGWDHTKWASNKLPTRQDLDVVTGDHPAYLQRTDGHIAVVNTAALKAANITGATKAPQGSQIDLDAAGNPTGIVREDAARALIEAHIPKPDAAARRKALQLAIDDALSHGVTSVQDFSDWDDFLVLEQMERDHKLNLRISEWLTFNDSIDVLKQHRAAHPLDDPLLHTGMLKGFMDGSLGSRTAAMLAPYSDDPTNSGLPRYNQAKLDAMTKERAAAGFQIGFHAIGDRANTMALNAFTQAKSTAASRDRIEHAQVLTSSDFERFHKLGIIASMQPSHLLTDMAWAPARLGPERSKYAYAWKAFLDHGVTLAFGTDYPVESISPFRGLYSAVTRMNEAGTQTFQPQEKLTIQQAIYAYTQGSAFAENEEKLKGRLEPGYFADIAVLDQNLITATPREILNAKVLRTIVGGETVYLAK